MSSRDSVVTIETVGFSIEHIEPIAGFVYPTRSYVVAISRAAGIGRGVRVHFQNGKEIRAEPVAVDEKRHVTILKLEEEAPAPPLRVVDRPLDPGKELVAVAPIEGVSSVDPGSTTSDAQLHVGHVSTLGDRTILRFDASWPEVIGAPLFDCEGDVVGVRGWGAILPAKDILAVSPGGSPVDVKKWDFIHMHLGFLGQFDDRARVGVSTGFAAVYGDRWQVRLGMGVTGGLPKPSEREPEDQRTQYIRLQLEPTVGYRVPLSDKFPIYVVPQIGVVPRLDLTITRSTSIVVPDGTCLTRGGPCKVEPQTSSTTTASGSIAPAIGGSLVIPGAALGYQAHVDVQDPSRTTHQIYLGFEF